MLNIFEAKNPMLINSELIKVLGNFEEAVVLQQIEYWLKKNREENRNFIENRYWTFNSYATWQKDTFFFWSIDTVKRIFKRLEKKKVLLTDRFNKINIDRTKWYTINYEELEKIINEAEEGKLHQSEEKNAPIEANKPPLGQNAPIEEGNLPLSKRANCPNEEGNLHRPIPEITSEITSEINSEKKDSINNAQNFISPVLEEIKEMTQEIKIALVQPIQRFLKTFHLDIENETISELTFDVCNRLYNDYDIDSLEAFKGMVNKSLENKFLDELLMGKGVNIGQMVKEGRTKELEIMRSRVKMEYFASMASKKELAVTIEAIAESKKATKNRKKASQPKRSIRTELKPEWFDESTKEIQDKSNTDQSKSLNAVRAQKESEEIIISAIKNKVVDSATQRKLDAIQYKITSRKLFNNPIDDLLNQLSLLTDVKSPELPVQTI